MISRLVVLDDLAVISRSTAVKYKEYRPTVAQIGEELGVDHILEGSVRWQKTVDGPSRVRVTPELIRVLDDTQVWAERYDAVEEGVVRRGAGPELHARPCADRGGPWLALR